MKKQLSRLWILLMALLCLAGCQMENLPLPENLGHLNENVIPQNVPATRTLELPDADNTLVPEDPEVQEPPTTTQAPPDALNEAPIETPPAPTATDTDAVDIATPAPAPPDAPSDPTGVPEDSPAPPPSEKALDTPVPVVQDQAYTHKEDVALYIHLYGKLPPNFITKNAARSLGWQGGGLDAYAKGKCIGGDRFGNYEGNLPARKGRTYYECDIDTLGKSKRGAKRIVFSNDGLIYYTEDHYATFELLYGEE